MKPQFKRLLTSVRPAQGGSFVWVKKLWIANCLMWPLALWKQTLEIDWQRKLFKQTEPVLLCIGWIKKSILITGILASSACTESQFEGRRLNELETEVMNYLNGNQPNLLVDSVKGVAISGFCVLESYQGDISPIEVDFVAGNTFLKQHKLEADENHWHLLVKAGEQWYIARFANSKVPLVSPKPLFPAKRDCINSAFIKFTKQTDSANRVHTFPGV